MSNENTQPKQEQITPQELADKLDAVVDEVHRLAKIDDKENDWAREAVKYGKQHTNHENVILIPIASISDLCPELIEQVFIPAENMAKEKSGGLYIATPIKYIIVDRDADATMYYDNMNSIAIKPKSIGRFTNIRELIAITAHEYGHSYKKLTSIADFLTEALGDENHAFTEELKANRLSDQEALLDIFTDMLAKEEVDKTKYYYQDGYMADGHPSVRKHLKPILENMLGNEVFCMNGQFAKRKNGEYSFIPNIVASSHSKIKEIIAEKTRGKEKVNTGLREGYRPTKNGEIVTNWNSLQPAIEQKSEELMEKLDDMVNYGFDLDKKHEWLDLIKREVTEFKETHKPEFMDLSKLRQANWMDRAQKNISMNQQRM